MARVTALEKQLEGEQAAKAKQAAVAESLQLALSKERELNVSLQVGLPSCLEEGCSCKQGGWGALCDLLQLLMPPSWWCPPEASTSCPRRAVLDVHPLPLCIPSPGQTELELERQKIEKALATLPQVAALEAALADTKQQAAQDIAMLEQRANVSCRIISTLLPISLSTRMGSRWSSRLWHARGC